MVKRYIFSVSPIDIRSATQIAILYRWASRVAEGKDVRFRYSAEKYFDVALTNYVVWKRIYDLFWSLRKECL